jgi:aspartate kinase
VSIIVQKYGGSSVATPEQIKRVAARVAETYHRGHHVVVVVSAMGDTTDQLLKLAHQVSPQPHRRELDMLLTVGERISMSLLSMAIQDLDVPAVSFTGSQSGIITTDTHTNARIIAVRPHRIARALEKNKVVIVAGFQGVSESLEITSLGRGGSDTTAVALAAALNAEFAEICSDVDGVYSTDPRVLSGAHKIDQLTYDEMQTLADHGAKVLNAEAVEWAKRSGIEVKCVSTHDASGSGTSIKAPQKIGSQPDEVYPHSRISAITQREALLYASGPSTTLPAFMALLEAYNAIDVEVNITGDHWISWIPTLNLHRSSQLEDALVDLSEVTLRNHLAQVSMVGRALLSEDKEKSALKLSEALIKARGIEVFAREVNQGFIRWTVDLKEAPALLEALHLRFIEERAGIPRDS